MRSAYPGAVLAVLVLAGCSTGSPTSSAISVSTPTSSNVSAAVTAQTTGTAPSPASVTVGTEQPAPPEQNPTGDIPDTQAFVSYHSTAGPYQLDVPEGWARTTTAATASFISKLDGLQVTLAAEAIVPSAATDRSAVEQSGRAVQVRTVQTVQLPGGGAVLVDYTSNSEPDAVTGKQVRLENHAYMFFHGSTLATVRVWAPLGADNVDQWNRIANSFRWQ